MKEKVIKEDAAKIKLDEDGISQLQGAVVSTNWTAKEGRPDASASASTLSGIFPEPIVTTLKIRLGRILTNSLFLKIVY